MKSGLSQHGTRALPTGALLGVLFIALIHLSTVALYPRPIARDDLRHRVMALTAAAQCAPTILVAGDSRARSQVIPDIIANRIGVPSDAVLNMAAGRSGTPNARALYTEFASHFSRQPLMLLSVSFVYGNDGANPQWYLTDELMWSLGMLDRFKLAPTGQAALATFMPERAMYRELKSGLKRWLKRAQPAAVTGGGYRSNGTNEDMPLPDAEWDHRITLYRDNWFGQPDIAGAKWRQLRRDVRALCDAGVQLVITDMPEHPEFHRRIAGTYMEHANQEFAARLQALAIELGIPIWNYNWSTLGLDDPDAYFVDALHLNERGAEVLSGRVGEDVRMLLGHGTTNHGPSAHPEPGTVPRNDSTALRQAR